MIVLDTHALVWWLSDPSKLSAAAKKSIRASERDKEILASTASILEIATLVRRQRLILATPLHEWLADMRALPELHLVPISADIAAQAGSFDGDMHGDPIDRLIVATAVLSKARLVTADANIRSLDVIQSVW